MSRQINSALDKAVATYPHQLAELALFFKHIHTDVSFWGHRYVWLEGSNDRMCLQFLARRVNDLFWALNTTGSDQPQGRFELMCRQGEISQEQCDHASAILTKLYALYQESDRIRDHKNRLTRFLCAIRDVWLAIYNPGRSLLPREESLDNVEHVVPYLKDVKEYIRYNPYNSHRVTRTTHATLESLALAQELLESPGGASVRSHFDPKDVVLS